MNTEGDENKAEAKDDPTIELSQPPDPLVYVTRSPLRPPSPICNCHLSAKEQRTSGSLPGVPTDCL